MYKAVYIEYVFIDNFIMNVLIIQLSSHVCGLKHRAWRAAVSACIGAVYAVCLFLPQMEWLYALPLKAFLSLVMVITVWGYGGLRKFLLRTAAFAGTTFLFGGAALGMAYGFNGSISNGIVYFKGFSFRLLAAACMLATILARLIRESLRNTKFREGLLYPLKITFQNRAVIVDAYLDTGNMLYDTCSGMPVIIIQYRSISHILPDGLSICLFTKRYDITAEAAHKYSIHLLPFKSIGKADSIYSIRPDSVEIFKNNAWKRVDAILGVSKTELSDGFEALLHPLLLQGS